MSGQIGTEGSLALFREQATTLDHTTIEGVGQLVMAAAEVAYGHVTTLTHLSREAVNRCVGHDLPTHLVMQHVLRLAGFETVLYDHPGIDGWGHTSLRSDGQSKGYVIDLAWQSRRNRPWADTERVPSVLFSHVYTLPEFLTRYDVDQRLHPLWTEAMPSPITYHNSGLSGLEPIFDTPTQH